MHKEDQFCWSQLCQAIAMESNVWVTWKENNSKYDEKTHSVPLETIVDPPKDLSVGTSVTVYWSYGKKYWKGVIAPSTKDKCKSLNMLCVMYDVWWSSSTSQDPGPTIFFWLFSKFLDKLSVKAG